ncbi:MAG: hypothetical protein FGM15_01960 [Chthoniobacterales bacterium]|nr:hypothetical protein [Chthoniobacterales bacterium]
MRARNLKTPRKFSVVMAPPSAIAGFFLAAFLFLAPAAQAADGTWSGGSGSLWSDTGNWSASPVPGSGNTATFNSAGNGNTTIDLGVGVTISNLAFDTANAAAYTIGSGAVGSQTNTLNNSNAVIAVAGTVANSQVINANIVLGTAITGTTRIANDASGASGVALNLAGNITGGTGGTAGTKTVIVSGTGAVNLQGAITRGGASSLNLLNLGTGTMTLSGSATSVLSTLRATNSSGRIIVDGQTVNVSSNSQFGNSSGNGGSFELRSGSATFSNGLTGTGAYAAQEVKITGGTFTASTVSATNIVVNGGTFSSGITRGAFTLDGSAAAAYIGANIASNTPLVNLVQGTLGAKVASVVINNPSLTLSGAEVTIKAADAGDVARTISIWSPVSGAYGFTKTGGGALKIETAATNAIDSPATLNTYSGTTTLEAGQLILNKPTALGTGAFVILGGSIDCTTFMYTNVTLSNNNAQSWNGDFAYVGSVTNLNLGAGAVTMNASRTVTVSNNELTVGGAISGSGYGLTKAGAGTLNLTGASTYSGATAVNAGTLKVNGSVDSSVTVNSGGTLAGSGYVGGLIVGSGGTISPGNSPGTLTATNAVWNAGGNYNWQIYNATGAAGSGWDLLTVTGTLDLSALSVGSEFNINIWSLSQVTPDVDGEAINFNPAQNYSWTIATASGGITGYSGTSQFLINTNATKGAAGFANLLDGGNFSVVKSGSNLNLVFTSASAAVPEPGPWAAAALLAGGAGFVRWRKRANVSQGQGT